MSTCLYADSRLAAYGFPEGHPFGIDRQDAFLREAQGQGLLDRVRTEAGNGATPEMLARFHQPEYIERVRTAESARIDYLDAHFAAALRAVQRGVPLKGYFIWSLMDNYEWSLGYEKRFGLIHVDFKSLKRTPKASYHALADALNR